MASLALSRSTRPARHPAADLNPALRTLLATGAALIGGAILVALARVAAGAAPHAAALKEVALAVHVATVVPALPLGAWVLLARKGTPRHRLLGKLWLTLMVAAALSAIWVRHLNHGLFSPIHLLVPLVLVGSWRVIATARHGDILGHRRVLLSLFIGGLLAPGLLSFIPGRLMWGWLLG